MSVEHALEQARAAYVAANPRSRERWEDACRWMPGGNTRTVLFHEPFPLGIVRAEGCRIWDADGHSYIDLLGEYTAGLFGHSDPVILGALRSALDGGINLSGHSMVEARFAAAVCERFGLDLVRFTNSGTEANLMALATATVVTGRRKVLVFDGAYHGGLLVFSGGGQPINAPHEYVVGTYNDAGGAARLLEEHRKDLAAVLVEPMLGAGGCVPGEEAFLQTLADGAAAHGALLIFDEVMTSRLAPGGRQSSLGIRPDLTTLGKYLAGGMSFGAFGGRAELMALYDPRRPDAMPHAGTFNNNVLSMTAGLAALTERLKPEVLQALDDRGEALRSQLNDVLGHTPLQVTGLGSIMAVHATDRPIRNAADVAAGEGPLKELFFFDMLRRGIHLARRGFIALSLPVSDAECEEVTRAVEAFVTEHAELLGGLR
jgi:glutamate-1-semialdehyde 2,1-aminomutase